jgi:hypothetical protein
MAKKFVHTCILTDSMYCSFSNLAKISSYSNGKRDASGSSEAVEDVSRIVLAESYVTPYSNQAAL